jgi:hypothetical protein
VKQILFELTTKFSQGNSLSEVDINGNGSDVDLTHWDVSHVSDASRAFAGLTAFNQDSDGSIGITNNICKGVCCHCNSNIRMLST